MDIKNIIFDLGGVLIDWDPRYVYRTLFETEAEVETFLKEVTTMSWNIEQDRGRLLSEATSMLVDQFPHYEKEIEAYYGRWTEMLGGEIPGTVKILKTFKEDPAYEIYALTNWSAETFPHAQERYNFLSWFKGIVVSGVEQCIKPEPDIYNILFERFDLDPATCLFIDDNEANVQASIDLGMPAIQFVNPLTLKIELENIGLLSQ